MALESGTYISDLNPSNPVGATDKVSTLDDHVRLIKSTLQNTFPNIDGAVTATEDELNHLDGVTGTTGTGRLVLDDAPTIADLTVSGTEFEVNADALDFNGPVDISGTLAVGSAATFSNDVTVGGTISGNGSGLTNLNASNLSSGTVPSDRLPSTIGGNKTFSDNVVVGGTLATSSGFSVTPSGNTQITNNSPTYAWQEADTGEGYRAIVSGGSWFLQATTNGVDTIMQVDLDANSDISAITLSAATLQFNGAVRAGTAATSTSATLAAGQIHHRSSNTTVPSMNAGQWVAVQNTSTSSITLSQGSGVTLELGGTTITGNRTLLAKGFAFIYFRANGVGVVHGSGVT